MKTIIVDDEIIMIKSFERQSEGIPGLQLIEKFDDPLAALDYVRNNPIEIAFLDVEMPEMSGIELAVKIREIIPEVIVCFISAYGEYVRESNKINADYYILKPYKREQIEYFMDKARFLAARMEKRVKIVTFGAFEVFVDGEPFTFPSAKARELMAYMVDKRGAAVNQKEVFPLLWEGTPYSHNNAGVYRRTIASLRKAFDDVGCGSIFISLPQGVSLNSKEVTCDYYSFLRGDSAAKNNFNGLYLTEYSWAEETCGHLQFLKGECLK